MLKLRSATSQVERKGVLMPAQASTAKEFVDFLKAVKTIVQSHFGRAHYVFDNPYIHVGPTAQALMKDNGLRQ
jgi:hypothetical protein